jgi:leucyl aminopeptidase (aminopeptidase T)
LYRGRTPWLIRKSQPPAVDFTAEFNPELKWTVSDGDITPSHWKNLPDCEVFTSPQTLNGQIVIDGCLGDFFAEKYASLEDTPIRIEVKDGRAQRESLECKNEELRKEFEGYVFETDENSSRVGEFAIGTNTGLTTDHLLRDIAASTPWQPARPHAQMGQ